MLLQQFGGKITQQDRQRYEQSPQWQKSLFLNQEETNMNIGFLDFFRLLRKQFVNTSGRAPKEKLAVKPLDLEAFLSDEGGPKFVWYGHSVVLLRINRQTILIDPMLGPNAAPIAPFPIKRFSENTLDLIDDFPEIDLMLITHDHYDHLDWASINKLKAKTKKYGVALGVKRHLVSWGVEPQLIQEFDWWDQQTLEDIQITFTPTRHFSGRGLRDRAKCLWGGWSLKTEQTHVWFSGDGGHGDHFKTVGERLGPFDFAFMECGQYNEMWHLIHLFPEESVEAAIQAQVKKAMPVHWAGFSLAQHLWTDPADRFVKHAQTQGLDYTLPRLGQVYSIEETTKETWWSDLES